MTITITTRSALCEAGGGWFKTAWRWAVWLQLPGGAGVVRLAESDCSYPTEEEARKDAAEWVREQGLVKEVTQ